MYVAVTGRGKARVIQFCEQHRIPHSNKKRTEVIKTIGNYEKLLEENPNIIAELKEEAKKLSLQRKEEKQKRKTQKNSLFRFGHILVKEMWKQLDLDSFFISQFGKKEGEKLSYFLFTLVVYRLGSSYKNFRTNRKIPFFNLSSLSEEEFYNTLKQIAKIQKPLMKHLQTSLQKKTKQNSKNCYCHFSEYSYHPYWNILQKQDKVHLEKNEIPILMLLIFDTYGIPLFFALDKDYVELNMTLDTWQKENPHLNGICLSPEIASPNISKFLYSSPLLCLEEEIQKKIAEEHRWYILEKNTEKEEVLRKELNFPWGKNAKFYIHWSKKRALKDYLENTQKQGYLCLYTNDMTLENKTMLDMYQHIWKIEDKFLISEVEFEKEHIEGHFTLCVLCLCIIRYFQYLLGSEGQVNIPMIYANKAISNPMILEEEDKNNKTMTPLHITNSYLKLAALLGIPPLDSIMEEKEFLQNGKLLFSEEFFS